MRLPKLLRVATTVSAYMFAGEVGTAGVDTVGIAVKTVEALSVYW